MPTRIWVEIRGSMPTWPNGCSPNSIGMKDGTSVQGKSTIPPLWSLISAMAPRPAEPTDCMTSVLMNS